MDFYHINSMGLGSKRIFSLSTGNFYQWVKSKSEYDHGYYDYIIGICRKFEIDGIEIFFAFNESVRKFSINEENLRWLRSLDYVTVHAPVKFPKKDEDAAETLERISRIYKKINAKHLIIHPVNFPRRKILDRFDFKVSTENLGRKRNIPISEIKKIVEKNNIGLCLDVAHAYFWSKHETRKIIKTFGKRITQVHFSAAFRRKPHVSFGIAGRDFIYSARPVRNLEVPIIIEQKMETRGTDFVKSEIRRIKSFFNCQSHV